MIGSGCPPASVDGHAIWLRLRSDDPTAPADLADAYFEPLARWLARLFPRVDVDQCFDAAVSAVTTLAKNPGSYRPDRKNDLYAYLRMAARGDLLNLLRSERRRAGHQASLEVVELSPKLGKYLRDDAADPSLIVEASEGDAAARADLAALIERISDGLTTGQQKVLELICNGERKNDRFAQALGLENLPLDEQRRAVKREKDRLKKRLLRAVRLR